MLQAETKFPHVGSLGFLAKTAEPARIIRSNADGTLLVERRRRLPGGGTVPLLGASANRTIAASSIFANPEIAIHGSAKKARQAQRRRAAGGKR